MWHYINEPYLLVTANDVAPSASDNGALSTNRNSEPSAAETMFGSRWRRFRRELDSRPALTNETHLITVATL